jgi:hypothetical protein
MLRSHPRNVARRRADGILPVQQLDLLLRGQETQPEPLVLGSKGEMICVTGVGGKERLTITLSSTSSKDVINHMPGCLKQLEPGARCP